jgi:hypothetical protein
VSEPNSPVDPGDLDLLRTDQEPDPAALVRLRSRLAAVIPMGGGRSPGGEGPAPDGAPSRAVPTASRGLHGIVTAAFLVGGVVGAALYAGLVKSPPRVVYVDRPVFVTAASAASAAAGPVESSAAPQAPAAGVPPVVPRPPSPRNRASQLSAERVLLDEARTAVAQGDVQRGLDRLERHRALFPNALLVEERDALQVQALVKAARYDEARAHADAFRRRAPSSLFMPMVDAAIDSIP